MPRSAVVSLVFLACVLGGAPLSAASFSLTSEQRQEAIRFGQRSVVSEDFDREWRTVNAAGETLKVVTPFFRLAQAARNAAFKSERLSSGEIEELLKEQRHTLLFWAFLRGRRAEFARWYRPVLLVEGAGEVQPSFVQNERTALQREDGRFLARCLYTFSTKRLTSRGRMTLLIRDHDGREVTKFLVDLATMR